MSNSDDIPPGTGLRGFGEKASEAFVEGDRQRIALRLQEARASIAAGRVEPLEPLSDLLREARERAG